MYDFKLPGRSGRAGRTGEAVTFYSEDDVPLLRSVAHVIFSSGGDVPPWMLSLPKVQKRRFKPRDSESNEPTPSTVVVDKKQTNKSPSQKPMVNKTARKPEDLKKTKGSTTKTGNRPVKNFFKVSSKNSKTLNNSKKVKK